MSATFESNMSLYIPRVHENYDKNYIASVFRDMGEVKSVDLIGKQDRNGKYFNSAYVHFFKWHSTEYAKNFYDKVLNEEEPARLYYDGGWYWFVLPNVSKKYSSGERKQTINIEGSSAY